MSPKMRESLNKNYHVAVIITMCILTYATSNISAQNQSAVTMPKQATKERVIQREPDFTYSVNDGESAVAKEAELSDLVPDKWAINHQMVQSRDADVNPTPPMTPEDLQRLQEKLSYRKQLLSKGESAEGQENVRTEGEPLEDIQPQAKSVIVSPKVGVGVQSTYTASASSVPDGAAAVNGAGKIVVANNTHIEIYDVDGTQLYSQAEGTFWSPHNPTANIYDPRVEYDSYNNRFIIVEMHGNQPSMTQIYIAVSKTSDPEGGWWFYKFNANSGDPTLWFDYPSIGYSQQTLTVAGNMFTASGTSATESKVYLFELYDAYNGLAVSSWYFDNVGAGSPNTNAYSIKPCSYPFGTYGPGLYMMSRYNSDYIAWWDISANAGNNPVMNGWFVNVGTLNNPVSAPQSGGTSLAVSSRLQSTYVDVSGVDEIHFTYAISDSNGDDRLLLGRLNTSNENVVYRDFGLSGYDYTYPRIMPWTTYAGSWDGGSLISFLRVSSTTFPQFRVVHGYPYSNWGGSVQVKNGESQIASGNRWGDYVGGGFREGQSDPECWVYGQYGLDNDHGMWLAQISLNIEGCTDPQACNYNPSATLDDGSCDFVACAGCTNSNACNYNPNAIIDDGSCTIPGCTSLGACNFSFSAGCDDGSCCFDNCVRLVMTDGYGDGWNGATYSLSNSSGVVVTSGTMSFGFNESVMLPCLPDGCYEFTVTGGTYPSEIGWSLENVYAFIIFGVDNTFATGVANETQTLLIGGGGSDGGCTDAAACNYDVNALCDNNSCCYSSCLTVSMTDGYGDGWNNNIWEIWHTGTLVESGTLENGTSGIDIACLDPGCYTFSINSDGGMYSYEIGWTLEGLGTTVTGNYLDVADFTFEGGGTDAGCMDALACNFDINAICDDGSFCCYDNCGILTMTDTYGDGWNNAYLTITDENSTILGTYSFYSGFNSEAEICLPNGCYMIDVSMGTWPSEVGWSIQFPNHMIGGGAQYNEQFNLFTVDGCTDVTSCNYNPSATCDNGSCAYEGCGDINACNYDSGGICHVQLLCDYSCVGCTYFEATNYGGVSVTIDDGTCVFASSQSCDGDLDGDGQVDTNDLLMFLVTYGTTCL